jgi:anti-sigma factor RsiW
MHEFMWRLRFRRDHRWAPDRTSAYLDGELAGRRLERMDRHVSECRECRRLIGGLTLVIDGLRRLPPPDGGGGAVQIAAAVRARLSEPRGS